MKKNLITYSLLFVISFSSITTIPKPVRAYEIKKYSNGFVYIVKPGEVIIPNKNDVVVVDERKENSNINIINSYKIININKMLEIIDIILEYDKKNKIENYDRTKFSLTVEWLVHNFLYYLFIARDRTADVDFENNEENLYNLKTYFKK